MHSLICLILYSGGSSCAKAHGKLHGSPEKECQNRWQTERQKECQKERQNICQIECQNLCQIDKWNIRMPDEMSDRMPGRMPIRMSYFWGDHSKKVVFPFFFPMLLIRRFRIRVAACKSKASITWNDGDVWVRK